MNKRPNIIIKNQDGKMSFHKSWANAARTYGWNDKESRNISNALNKHGEFEGLTKEDMEMDISIPCQYLRKLLLNGEKQSSTFNNELEGLQVVVFTVGEDRRFTIDADVLNRIIVSEVSTDALGHDLTHSDYAAQIDEINEVINENGEVIKLDKTTEDILFEKLEL